MSLATRLTTVNARNTGGHPCSVSALYDALPTSEERVVLDRMLYDPHPISGLRWTAAQVYDAVHAEGYALAFRSINRHRSGKCRCSL